VNRIIQTAIERAAESATKETLTLVFTSLGQSQADGLMLPEAVRRLKAAICDRFGLEPEYLQGLGVEGLGSGDFQTLNPQPQDPFELWLSRVVDAFPPGTVMGPVEELRDWYASLWSVELAVDEIKRRDAGEVRDVRHLRP
jgi:hypothetical protein